MRKLLTLLTICLFFTCSGGSEKSTNKTKKEDVESTQSKNITKETKWSEKDIKKFMSECQDKERVCKCALSYYQDKFESFENMKSVLDSSSISDKDMEWMITVYENCTGIDIDELLKSEDNLMEEINTDNIESYEATRDTIKVVNSNRQIKEECDCVHMANNILYGNFQSLDIITSKEVFEEYQEEIENNFWFGSTVAYCVEAFNSSGYMGQNSELDGINIDGNPGQRIDLLINALTDCEGVKVWYELSQQFEKNTLLLKKKYLIE